jgi:hypothetical protein
MHHMVLKKKESSVPGTSKFIKNDYYKDLWRLLRKDSTLFSMLLQKFENMTQLGSIPDPRTARATDTTRCLYHSHEEGKCALSSVKDSSEKKQWVDDTKVR